MQEKVWAVVCQDAEGVSSVLVFDYEADAQHFASEMDAGKKGTHTVFATSVHRRHEKEAALAHIELPEFSTKCIECLVDIPSIPDEGRRPPRSTSKSTAARFRKTQKKSSTDTSGTL